MNTFKIVIWGIISLVPFLLSSCESLIDHIDQPVHFTISSIQWMPGDTVILAYVSIPIGNGRYQKIFRIYDQEGRVVKDFPPLDSLYVRDYRLLSDGKTVLIYSSNDILLLDLATNTIQEQMKGELISFAPDEDRLIVYPPENNFGPYSIYSTFSILNNTFRLESKLTFLDAYYGRPYYFPVLLAGSKLATIEFDSTNTKTIVVLDSTSTKIRVIPIETGIYFSWPKASSRADLFFAIKNYNSAVYRIDINSGAVDSLFVMRSYYYDYMPTSEGKKLIYWDENAIALVVKDLQTGTVTSLGKFHRFALSRDDAKLAVVSKDVNGDDQIQSILLP